MLGLFGKLGYKNSVHLFTQVIKLVKKSN